MSHQKKEKRKIEVRVIVQPSLYELLEKKAGNFRTISEVVREILAEYFEEKK